VTFASKRAKTDKSSEKVGASNREDKKIGGHGPAKGKKTEDHRNTKVFKARRAGRFQRHSEKGVGKGRPGGGGNRFILYCFTGRGYGGGAREAPNVHMLAGRWFGSLLTGKVPLLLKQRPQFKQEWCRERKNGREQLEVQTVSTRRGVGMGLRSEGRVQSTEKMVVRRAKESAGRKSGLGYKGTWDHRERGV